MDGYELKGAWVFSMPCSLASVARRGLVVRGEEVKRQLREDRKQAPVKPAEYGKATHIQLTERHVQKSRITVLPVEPHLVHVYWEVNSDELDELRHRLGDEYRSSKAVLRFYDVTNIILDDANVHSFFDVSIDLGSKNSYVHLWAPEKSYSVELGFKTKDGRCFPLAQSNVAQTPRAWPAPRADNRFVLVEEDTNGRLSSTEVHVERFLGDGKLTREPRATAEIQKTHPVLKTGGAKEQPLDPKVSWRQEVDGQHRRDSESDLTAMNEKSFVFGLSS